MVWNKTLLLYTDANTNDNPSKKVHLTVDATVTVKGSDKLVIEVTKGKKTDKRYEFKVESGDINKWKSKLDEEIDKNCSYEDSEEMSEERRGSTVTEGYNYNYQYGETYNYEEDIIVGPKKIMTKDSFDETYDDVNDEIESSLSLGPPRFVPKKSPLPPLKKAPKQSLPQLPQSPIEEWSIDEDDDSWSAMPPSNRIPIVETYDSPPDDSPAEDWSPQPVKKNPPPSVPFLAPEPNYVNDDEDDLRNAASLPPSLPPKKPVTPKVPNFHSPPQRKYGHIGPKDDEDEDRTLNQYKSTPTQPKYTPTQPKYTPTPTQPRYTPTPTQTQKFRPNLPNQSSLRKPSPNPKPVNLGNKVSPYSQSSTLGGNELFKKRQEAIQKALGKKI